MKIKFLKLGFLATIFAMTLFSCSSDDDSAMTTGDDDVSEEVGTVIDETTLGFVEGNVSIVIEEQTLSDGSVAEVYAITASNSTSLPVNHDMGPWCPTNVNQNEDTDGGIWLDNDTVYQVTGEFLSNLATFYDDATWNLIEDDGVTIKYISDREGCEAAARPEVDPEYQNHCVQCLPEWFEDDDLTTTYYIPVNPVKLDNSSTINDEHGIAFSGVIFDAPAPVDAILSAYTLAAFDNAGGHVNPIVGYHYHTATGMTKTIDQTDDHAGQIGYAFDGFEMYEYDGEGDHEDDLDDCRGHEDDIRGYHYHVSAPGVNETLPCFSGAVVGEEDGQGGGGPPM